LASRVEAPHGSIGGRSASRSLAAIDNAHRNLDAAVSAAYAGMTFVASGALATGVIPAQAGTQYTKPQGCAFR
jgi:hypothetical protein